MRVQFNSTFGIHGSWCLNRWTSIQFFFILGFRCRAINKHNQLSVLNSLSLFMRILTTEAVLNAACVVLLGNFRSGTRQFCDATGSNVSQKRRPAYARPYRFITWRGVENASQKDFGLVIAIVLNKSVQYFPSANMLRKLTVCANIPAKFTKQDRQRSATPKWRPQSSDILINSCMCVG